MCDVGASDKEGPARSFTRQVHAYGLALWRGLTMVFSSISNISGSDPRQSQYLSSSTYFDHCMYGTFLWILQGMWSSKMYISSQTAMSASFLPEHANLSTPSGSGSRVLMPKTSMPWCRGAQASFPSGNSWNKALSLSNKMKSKSAVANVLRSEIRQSAVHAYRTIWTANPKVVSVVQFSKQLRMRFSM